MRTWDDNIIKDLSEIGCEVVDWIHVVQDTDRWFGLVNMAMNFRFFIKGGELFKLLSDY